MKRRKAPSLSLLHSIYYYDDKSGEFIFKIDVGTRGRVGYVAGAKRVDGYIGIALGGKVYLAHHLAWYYFYGKWVERIDHKDRNKSNNSIGNLRPASRGENGVNSVGWAETKRKHKLPKGVYLDRTKSSKFMAAIRIKGKLKILGFYSSTEEASAAYQKASIEHHGVFSLWAEKPDPKMGSQPEEK